MNILKVLHVDSIIFLRKLPLIFVAIFLCIGSFLLALPPQLLESGTIPKVNIAFAYEGEESEITELAISFLGNVDVIGDYYIVTREEMEQMIEDGTVDAAVSFPDDTVDAFVYGEPLEIEVITQDEFIGSFAYNLVNEAVQSVNRATQYAMRFHYMIKPLFEDKDEYFRVDMAFQMALVNEALNRISYVKTEPIVPPFNLQAMSLILFLLISIVAVFMTTITANQLSSGGLRRFKIRGITFLDVWIAKAIIVVGLSLILCLLASIFFILNNTSFSILRFLLSAVFLSIIMHMICMVFTLPKYKPAVASSRAMLGCIAMLLIMLFAGGGFYPVHLMDFSIKIFNPAWLSHLLSEWILGGAPISVINLILFMIPAIILGLLSLRKWREVL